MRKEGSKCLHPFFFCLHLWKIFLTGYRILDWQVFTFSTLKMLFHCFLAWFDEKSVSLLVFIFLYVISFFLSFFHNFLFYHCFPAIWLCGLVWFCVYPTWDLLSFLVLRVYSFHQLWKIFSHWFSNIFSALLSPMSSRNPITCWVFDRFPWATEALFIFLFLFLLSVLQFEKLLLYFQAC